MSPDQSIFEDHYYDEKLFVSAIIVVINPQTGNQVEIKKELKVDTGFDGGIHIAKVHRSDILLTGINLTLGEMGVAGGGTPRLAEYCTAYLQQIGDYEFPMPGIEAMLILQGESRHGLLGMEALNNWLLKLDGPNRHFKISCP